MLVIGAPDTTTSPRFVKVYTLENNAYVERANLTAPAGAPENSRFGQQARLRAPCHRRLSMRVITAL